MPFRVVPRPANTIPYPALPAKAWIHAQHDQYSTSGMDPHLSGEGNNVPKLQDQALVEQKTLNINMIICAPG